MYPVELTTPISKDLTDFGFEGLTQPEDVEGVLENKEGTVLLVVNSVCGCAAANARPGAKLAVTAGKSQINSSLFLQVLTKPLWKKRENICFLILLHRPPLHFLKMADWFIC